MFDMLISYGGIGSQDLDFYTKSCNMSWYLVELEGKKTDLTCYYYMAYPKAVRSS